MNGKEGVHAMLQRESLDRVPVFMRFSPSDRPATCLTPHLIEKGIQISKEGNEAQWHE
jgi:hypothetical protein